MYKFHKIQVVRLGDAKRLTRGGIRMNVELDGRPQINAG